MLLALLYWIILILSVIGIFAPATWPHAARISGFAQTVLFILLGLRVFKVSMD